MVKVSRIIFLSEISLGYSWLLSHKIQNHFVKFQESFFEILIGKINLRKIFFILLCLIFDVVKNEMGFFFPLYFENGYY